MGKYYVQYIIDVTIPETLEQEEPIPCNALAINNTLQLLPNANTEKKRK